MTLKNTPVTQLNVLYILLLPILLSSCGYKGALYLSNNNQDKPLVRSMQTGIRLEPRATPSTQSFDKKNRYVSMTMPLKGID